MNYIKEIEQIIKICGKEKIEKSNEIDNIILSVKK